jgi:hypothetical protein
VVNEPVDHRGSDDVVAQDLALTAEGLVGVTIIEARSQRRETSMNIRLAACGPRGADLVDNQQWVAQQPRELLVQAPRGQGVVTGSGTRRSASVATDTGAV